MRTDVIFNTDAVSGLGRLPDNSIDCIVTSPPYWQLRDYGLSPILFGGRQKCEHDFDDYAACRSCGGWLGQLGQEPSREMFLEHLAGIFDECRRVLKSTGTLWVNLGDSYSKLNKYNRTDDWPPGKNVHCLKTLRVDLSIHRQPVYKNNPAYVNGVAESLFKVGMCLPSGPYVTDDDVRYIVEQIKENIR